MTPTEHKLQIFEDILRLRRIGRRAPGNREVVVVRAHLQQTLGATVTATLAARILGVPRGAVRRLCASGDLPLVITPSGGRQIPVASLVTLREAMRRHQAADPLVRLEAVVAEWRIRAERLDPLDLVGPEFEAAQRGGSIDPHRRAELRSLAIHRMVARGLRRAIADEALHLVWQWAETGMIDPRFGAQWEEILRGPLAAIRRMLEADDPEMAALRQSSPFAGMLTPAERDKILAAIR